MDRCKSYDIAKALGIILVVLGHVTYGIDAPRYLLDIRNVIYQFHMPLFFFISGVFINENDTFLVFLKRKIRRLYLPFVISNLLFFIVGSALYYAFGGVNSIMDRPDSFIFKIFLGLETSPIVSSTWFLVVLFESLIIYRGLYIVCEKTGNNYVLSIIILLLAVIRGIVWMPYCIGRIFISMVFIDVGRHFGRIINAFLARKISVWKISMIGVLCLTSVIICSCYNIVNMSDDKYGNIVLFFISSFAGILLILITSNWMSHTKIGCRLAYLGTSTMWVLIGHMLAFKLVTIMQLLLFHLPLSTILIIPCNIVSGIWAIMYLIFGCCIPLVAKRLYTKTLLISKPSTDHV